MPTGLTYFCKNIICASKGCIGPKKMSPVKDQKFKGVVECGGSEEIRMQFEVYVFLSF